MAHFAGKRFNYWEQLGIFVICCGAGMFVGGILTLAIVFSITHPQPTSFAAFSDGLKETVKHASSSMLRWLQFISTLFTFFLPAIGYARYAHRNTWLHLGFSKKLNMQQLLCVALIMVASLSIVGALQELTTMLPWPKSVMDAFKDAEANYNEQVNAMATMKNFGDFALSLIVMAFLPAMFEEVLFRGAAQNLLTRWFKHPIWAIVAVSLVFSWVHGSYLGFLSRFALSFILGWMYYRTGNIWLNIVGHFLNNAIAVTALYLDSLKGHTVDAARIDEHFPLWAGIIGLVAVMFLFRWFERLSGPLIDRPGEEVSIPGYFHPSDPISETIHHTNA